MRLLKLPAVMERTAKARSSIYQDISKGLMVKPVHCGRRSVAFPENEIMELIAARIAGKNDSEIRDLVAHLMNQRMTLAK